MMPPCESIRGCRLGLWLLAGLLVLGGCDAVEPVDEARIVVEAFFEAGRSLPPVTLRRTAPLSVPYEEGPATALTGAEVVLELDGRRLAYRPDPAVPGRYVPEQALMVPPRARYTLTVRWDRQTAQASGTIPPPITLDAVEVNVPDRPVEAVLLDSLNIVIDSLNVDARQGFIYPVEVTLRWPLGFEEVGADSLYWVETRLTPRTPFASALIDFFLLPEQILRERSLPRDAQGRHRWQGVYAVPVETAEAPLPVHELKVALLRSGQAYARFATTRDAPERREPRSNVEGGLGIVAGISVDSLRLQVGPGGLTAGKGCPACRARATRRMP